MNKRNPVFERTGKKPYTHTTPLRDRINKASTKEITQLIQDLKTNQNELEGQNEMLWRTRDDLSKDRDRYANLFDFAPIGYLVLDQSFTIHEANLKIATMLGTNSSAMLGNPISRYIYIEDQDQFYSQLRQFFQTGEPDEGHLRLVKADDGVVETFIKCVLVWINEKWYCRMAVHPLHMDIRAGEITRLSSQIIENTMEGIIVTDSNANILMVNPAFTHITGYLPNEVIGHNPRILNSSHHDANFYKNMWQSLNDTGHWEDEIWNRRKDGEIYPQWMNISAIKNELDQITHYVAVFHDITTLKMAETRIHHMATHDALTNLPNRMLFWDRLELMINQAHRDKQHIAVIFLDLDQFKWVNDTYGHQVGDRVLTVVAARLTKCLRESDTVARMGGDEFTILLGSFTQREMIGILAQKYLDAIVQPIRIDDIEINLTCSMGISLYPGDGLDAEMLMKNADRAMYTAKEEGKNRFRFFTSEMDLYERKRLALANSLRQAFNNKEFYLLYQPQVDLHSGQIVSVEALLRWQHPILGLIPPNTMISLAEEIGLIKPVCNWVLETACEQNKAWQQITGAQNPIKVTVNIASYQYQRGDLVNMVSELIHQCGLSPESVELDLKEDTLIKDPDMSASLLEDLKNTGVGLNIDDFGAGYSCLPNLNRFPVKTLKIDRSLINNMIQNPGGTAIVVAIIGLAHIMGLKVVASGVETEEQLQILQSQGCDQIQGYYFYHPVKADKITEILQEGRRLETSENRVV